VPQVEALLHAAQHGMTALKELARCWQRGGGNKLFEAFVYSL
jgi:hypothetical protein